MPRLQHAIVLFCFSFIFLCFFTPAGARIWVPAEVPNPKTHPSACIDLASAKQGVRDGEAELEWMWVCNPENLLDSATVDSINLDLHELSKLEQKGCNRGIQVGVLVIDKMATGSSEEGAMKFAKEIHELWGVGDRTCNNGVVFLLALGDRKWYISTGTGVNQILTEYAIMHIKDKITPILKNEDYNWAAITAVSIMKEILQLGEPFEKSNFEVFVEVIFITIMIVIFLVVFCKAPFLYFKNVAQRRTRREERRRQLQDMERRMQQGTNFVPITMCSICMEDLLPNTNHNHENENSNSVNNSNNNNFSDANMESGESSSLRHRTRNTETSNTKKKEDREMKTKLLFCGHKFHKKCINDWLARNNTCPICRRQRPTEPDAPQEPSGARAQAAGADQDFLIFAQQRLLYYSIWNVPTHLYIPPSSPGSSGGGGGGFSFGGGSGFGGGGGGGGW